MDIFNDNRSTPKKRTGAKNDTGYPDKDNNGDKDPIQIIAPEIAQPNPTSATPIIPTEIPARDIK